MAKKTNLSIHKKNKFEIAGVSTFAIVVSQWNEEITEALYKGAYNTLIENGVPDDCIDRINVPGSYELTRGAQMAIEVLESDAVICLGCVIQGETRHFEFICNAVAQGITNVSIESRVPVIFGVLTTDNFSQAKARSGGEHGNKGVEAAITALSMIQTYNDLIVDSGILENNHIDPDDLEDLENEIDL